MIRSSVERVAERALRVAKDALKDTLTLVRKETAQDLKEDLEEAYKNAVDAWYSGYAPQRYSRGRNKLYTIFEATIDSDGYVDWDISENISWPSWGRGTWDPYGQIVEAGLHGGPVGSHTPVASTPIPSLFESDEEKINEEYKAKKRRMVKEKFYDIFWSRY